MDMKTSSTIGFELAHNALLREEDEARFVDELIGGLGPQPPNFQAIVAINRGPLGHDGAEARPLVPRQLEEYRAAGALIVDVRTELQFDEAHIPGAVAITILRAGFGSKLAWLARTDQEVVFVGRDDEDARRAVALARSVAVTRIGGYLHGGMTSWREERGDVQRIERLDVAALHERLGRDPALQLLDVREEPEFRATRIPGSLHTPYHDLRELPDGLDPRRPVATICSSGQRAATAASLLQRHGADEVLHVVDGGVGTWARRGWDVEEG